MPTYKLRGIDVDFPYEAYDCQLVYMEKVIESLQNKCNALLESPTGTGKTLCLLCATLAWRKSLGAFSMGKIEKSSQGVEGTPSSQSSGGGSGLPTIVYTSRTHSQLRQVIQELKRSSYRPKTVILGSREQLCIHEEVSTLRGKAQNNACRFLCKKRAKRQCDHFSQVSAYVKQNPHLGDEPVDIEDLVKIGQRFGPCPYYISRELHKVVDILFAPYNYLIDPSNRKSLGIDWVNSVLIFDEAHNLEGICADAASFDLPSGILTACISEAQSCIDLCITRRDTSSDKSQNPENYAILKALLLKLEKGIADVPIESSELGFTRPGPYIYELLGNLNLTHDTATKLIDIIEEAALLLEEDKQQKAQGTACRLESIADILKLIFKDKDNAHATFYRVHVREGQSYALDVLKGKASRTLSWWCFNPGIAMEEFSKKGVGSIILTSGTLSPMESFAQELKLNFPVRLENPHVISSSQIWAGVVGVGPSGHTFNSSYRNRDSVEYKRELGNAIVNFARIVPDGLLVFFPSYYVLDKSIECWKSVDNINSTAIWERICRYKKPVVEPRQSALFPSAIQDYMAKLKDTSSSGAVFFAVCRGKVSEGLDFADQTGRAVIITGVPFPMRHDPKVRLKREFLDQQAAFSRNGNKSLTGEGWYGQQASRAVNQAVGRVIRHQHDYGAIIFCDERFSNANQQSQISLWIRPHLKCHSSFGDVVFTLSRFFRDGAFSSSTMLKSMEKVTQEKMSPQMDKVQTMPAEKKAFNVSSMLPFLQDKSFRDSSKLHEILPANCASLNPPKSNQDFILKHSKGLISKEKPLLVLGGNTTQRQKQAMIDLTGESSARVISTGDGLHETMPAEKKAFNVSSMLPFLQDKIFRDSSKLHEILPANCASLNPPKSNQDFILKYSKGLISKEKPSLVLGGNTTQLQKQEMIDLTGESSVRVISTGDGLLPCSAKNHKVSKGKHVEEIKQEFIDEKPESNNFGSGDGLLPCSAKKRKLSKGKHVGEIKQEFIDEKPESNNLGSQGRASSVDRTQQHAPKINAAHSNSLHAEDKEKKAYEFLSQVKEKLTASEYTEFVSFMKALKSKAMKIGHVLQSIINLFAGPERASLRVRFRDHLPEKYRPLYEQYIGANHQLPDNQT